MTKRDVVAMALKIVGVVFLVRGIVELPYTAWQTSTFFIYPMAPPGTHVNPALGAVALVSSAFLQLALGACLILYGIGIARFLVSDDGDILALTAGFSEKGVFQLALRIIGVVLLVEAVPILLEVFARSFLSRAAMISIASAPEQIQFAFKDAWANQWAGIVKSVSMLIIGIYLVFGEYLVSSARSLFKLYKQRTAMPEQDEP